MDGNHPCAENICSSVNNINQKTFFPPLPFVCKQSFANTANVIHSIPALKPACNEHRWLFFDFFLKVFVVAARKSREEICKSAQLWHFGLKKFVMLGSNINFFLKSIMMHHSSRVESVPLHAKPSAFGNVKKACYMMFAWSISLSLCVVMNILLLIINAMIGNPWPNDPNYIQSFSNGVCAYQLSCHGTTIRRTYK